MLIYLTVLLIMMYSLKKLTQTVKDYMKGLEYQMSDNELWSNTTLRYNHS